MAFMSDLERRDPARLRQWFSDESRLWMPPYEPITGARRILALFRAIFRHYAEIHWRVTEVHPAGPSRYVYLTDSWGTLDGGEPYRNHIATLVEFDDQGRIRYLSDYFKDTAVFAARQGGKAPGDGQPSSG